MPCITNPTPDDDRAAQRAEEDAELRRMEEEAEVWDDYVDEYNSHYRDPESDCDDWKYYG